jgi:hypothetical protein
MYQKVTPARLDKPMVKSIRSRRRDRFNFRFSAIGQATRPSAAVGSRSTTLRSTVELTVDEALIGAQRVKLSAARLASKFRNGGQRKSRDVIGYFPDFGTTNLEFGIQPLENWAGLQEIVTLTHNARTDVAQLPPAKGPGSELTQSRNQELIPEGSNIFSTSSSRAAVGWAISRAIKRRLQSGRAGSSKYEVRGAEGPAPSSF